MQVLRSNGARRALQTFSADARGNVAITLALCVLPFLTLIGSVIDYGRGLDANAQVQSALDATTLMVMQNVSTMNATQMQTAATNFFTSQVNVAGLQNLVLNVQYNATGGGSSSGPTVTITASASLPTTMMNLFNIHQMNISDSATAAASLGPRLRVAFILDNTGSMADSGKLTALKSAAKNLLSQLQQAATSTADVYVSIIPFTTDVDVESSNVNASWIDWSTWTSSSSGGKGRKSSKHSSWNGCVIDRDDSSGPDPKNYDANVSPPVTSQTATLFPADSSGTCPVAMIPLTNNWTSLTSEVDSMVAQGNTNQAIGLAHGWMSLVGGGPYPTPPAEDPNYKYQNVMILLSDGLNTQDRWYTNASPIDARQSLACANIKAAGIQLYTIQVDTDGSPNSSILQSCASSASDFFLLTSSSQIANVFQQIGNNLTQLRLVN